MEIDGNEALSAWPWLDPEAVRLASRRPQPLREQVRWKVSETPQKDFETTTKRLQRSPGLGRMGAPGQQTFRLVRRQARSVLVHHLLQGVL